LEMTQMKADGLAWLMAEARSRTMPALIFMQEND
jgi:hypothetical protein